MKKILLFIIFGLVTLVAITTVHAQPADNLLQNENIFDTLSVDLKVNGSDGLVEVAVGSRITISWESDGAKRCKGNWSKKDLLLDGKISGKLGSSVVNAITVRIACIDGDGNRADDSVLLKITGSAPSTFKNPVNPTPPPVTPPPSSLKQREQPSTTSILGEQKIIVFLVNYRDSGPVPFSSDEIKSRIFNGTIQKFINEQSYNRTKLGGDVFGWFTLPTNGPAQVEMCSLGYENVRLSTYGAFDSFLQEHNINVGQYQHIVFLVDHPNVGVSSGTIGKIDITIGDGRVHRASQSCVNLSRSSFASYQLTRTGAPPPFKFILFDQNFAHELLHGFGAPHAFRLDCGADIFGNTCKSIDYGNEYDILGTPYYGYHLNAVFKERFGWIIPSETIVIEKSGQYTLSPFEGSNDQKIAKIKMLGSSFVPYYLEYRRGTGFNAFQNAGRSSTRFGLLINRILSPSDPISYLLEAGPNASGAPWLLTKEDGTVFTDDDTGITIGPIKNTTSESITFDVVVESGLCTRRAPRVELAPSQPVEAHPDVSISPVMVVFENMDSTTCGASDFYATTVFSNQDTSAVNIVREVHPRKLVEMARAPLSFKLPADAKLGLTKIGYEIVNKTSGMRTKETLTVNVTPTPEPLTLSSIEPLSGSIGTLVTLKGSGFNQGQNRVRISKGEDYRNLAVFSTDGATLQFSIPSVLNNGVAVTHGRYEIEVFVNTVNVGKVFFTLLP
ncbi:MAG: hypothetical protein G01um101417_425 [Parcubacteria group bacterium Gr01-1014_17]|nr:MAG: hypothetical protein G01um101417_425 [Parcubacteria group bacterium Gr01-1014_17]